MVEGSLADGALLPRLDEFLHRPRDVDRTATGE